MHYFPIKIDVRFTVDGKRSDTNARHECDPSRRNTGAGRANGTKEDISAFNAYLDNLENQVYEACMVTAETLKNKLLRKGKCMMPLGLLFTWSFYPPFCTPIQK